MSKLLLKVCDDDDVMGLWRKTWSNLWELYRNNAEVDLLVIVLRPSPAL